MTNKPIHLHKNRLENNSNVLLLLIPGIIYILVLGLFFYGQQIHRNDYKIATSGETSVLGKETELDNPN